MYIVNTSYKNVHTYITTIPPTIKLPKTHTTYRVRGMIIQSP
jgi:hypothetical protein